MFRLSRRDAGSSSGEGSSFRYMFYPLAAWSALIVISAAWNLYQIHDDTLEKARIEAGTIFEHNVAYRWWNAKYGGIYAPVTPGNRPNPYIIVSDRDVTTATGKKLTLVNPFQMTRQAYELLHEHSPLAAINRTVSLHPVNPLNAPDPWEEQALRAFEAGKTEVSEIATINGRPYMRVLKPYITVKGCLKCHGAQGYKVGDIRGGMSIAIPMKPYLDSELKSRMTVAATHLLIWIFGTFGIVAFGRSIERHQRQTAESERKFRTLSDFAQDWEYWITEDRRIAYMSPSCKRITGYAPDEFTRDPSLLFDIIHPDDRARYQEHMTEGFKRPEHEEIDFRIITKEGQVKRLFHVCGPIFSNGRYLGRHVSNRDITYRKQLEEQLMQSQKMESLGLFAGGIAHDFNNLLTVITGYTTMIRKKLAHGDASIRKYLDDVLIAATKARSLTSSLLSFGRKQVMKRTKVSLNGIIGNLAGLLRRIIGEDIELRIRCAEREFPIFADPHQIDQVIMNLLTNARDAMPKGGVISIETAPFLFDRDTATRFGAEPGKKYMVLIVSDSGTGIDKDVLPHIFDPFYTTKEVGKGTGLGLAMVYGIVKQHGGIVSVDSKRGIGTVFRIYLPASLTHDGDAARDHACADNDLRGSETILVAEDEEAVKTFLKNVLEGCGYRTILAADGEEAIEAFRRQKDQIDLVVLDAVMPKRSGKEAYDLMRQQNGDVRAIFISGYTQDILGSRGMRFDDVEFVSKPIEVERFLTAIRKSLANRSRP